MQKKVRETLTLGKLVSLDSYLRRLIATNKNVAKPASKAYVDGSGTAEIDKLSVPEP